MIYLSAAKRVRATLLADARRIQPGRCCTLECKFHFATLHRHRERERERERIFSPRWTCPAFRLVYFDLFVPRIPLSVLSLLCYSVFQFPRKKKKTEEEREKEYHGDAVEFNFLSSLPVAFSWVVVPSCSRDSALSNFSTVQWPSDRGMYFFFWTFLRIFLTRIC